MGYYPLSAFLNGSLSLVLGIFVFLRSPERGVTRTYFLFTLSVALWSFAYFLWQVSDKPGQALFFCRTLMVGATFIPVLYLHHLFYLLKDVKSKKKILGLAYSFCFLALFVIPNNYFVTSVTPKLQFKFWPNPGFLFYIYFSIWMAFVIYTVFYIGRSIRLSSGKVRAQLKLILLGTTIGYAGGATNFFLWFNIPIPPLGNMLASAYLLLAAYAIMKFRMMDVEFFVKRSIVFLLSFCVISGSLTGLILLFQKKVVNYFSLSPMQILAFSVFAGIVLYEIIRQFLSQTADKYLFRGSQNTRSTLQSLARRVVGMLSQQEIAAETLSTLKAALSIESGYFVTRNYENERWEVVASINNEAAVDEIHLNMLLEEVKNRGKDTAFELPKQIFQELAPKSKNVLSDLSVCAPLIINKRINGFLLLGSKKDDLEYTQEELDFLSFISAQIGVALNNAIMVEREQKNQFAYAQQSKLAALGTMAAGIAHELNNPLNAARGCLEIFPIQLGYGAFSQMNREQVVDAFIKSVDGAIESIDRAAKIVRRMSGFLKQKNQFDIATVSVEEVAELTCEIISHDLARYNIEMTKQFAPAPLLIRADKDVMVQILINLLTNARDAIRMDSENIEKKIKISTAEFGNDIEIVVHDTGVGISKQNLDRIFDPFYTTKDVSRNPDPDAVLGTGLGLHLVKQMVEMMDGKIEVQSAPDKGTAFRLLFPRMKQ